MSRNDSIYGYYYRQVNSVNELIVSHFPNTEKPLSIRVTETDDVNGDSVAIINLPKEEIERLITALQKMLDK